MKLKRGWRNITPNTSVLLVVDSNVVISAALNRGNSLNVFLQNFEKDMFEFIAPQFLIIEIGKHTDKIAKKTNLSFNESSEVLTFIIDQITFYQDNEFSDKIKEARVMLKEHGKDVHYLALALAKNCDIFSGDKTFRDLCPEKVKTPRELLEELLSS